MNQIYYCELCEQKYIEHQEENTKKIYTERIADLNKEKPIDMKQFSHKIMALVMAFLNYLVVDMEQ